MKKTQFSLILIFTLVAGFIGGAVSSHIIQPVFAQKEPKHQKLVVAEEFRLVNKKGNTITRLYDLDGMPVLWMETYVCLASGYERKKFKRGTGALRSQGYKNNYAICSSCT